MKRLNFSPRSENALEDIGDWTTEYFGVSQAKHYSGELLATCRLIAVGAAHWRYCRDVFADDLSADLRFTRSGRHVIVFVETPTEILIVDFIHQSADIGGRLEGPRE